jgi:6-phosphogluconolactonase
MKGLIIVLMVSIHALLISCNRGDNMFIASGYSGDSKADVLLCKLDGNGKPEKLSEITVGDNPSFFASGGDDLIYFVNEVDSFDLKAGGGITTLRYDKQNRSFEKVDAINQGGGGPCHITVSADGNYLITANYGSGSVSVVRLNGDGMPGKVTDVIFYGEKSHPHMTIHNPRLNIYYISDLGLDRVYQLKLDTTMGLLMDADVPFFTCEPGSGPRHMVIDKSCANLYVINELASAISVYDILPETPVLKQTLSTLPDGFEGKNYCADIHFSYDRNKISGSNRGDNSLVTFEVGPDGTLSSPKHQSCGGNWPRNFDVFPSGEYFLVANQRSNEISVVPAGSNGAEETVASLQLNAPACVKFVK